MASYQTKPAMRSGAACVVLATAIAWMTIAIGSAAQAPGGNSPAQLFQQATHQEEAAGNLEVPSRCTGACSPPNPIVRSRRRRSCGSRCVWRNSENRTREPPWRLSAETMAIKETSPH